MVFSSGPTVSNVNSLLASTVPSVTTTSNIPSFNPLRLNSGLTLHVFTPLSPATTLTVLSSGVPFSSVIVTVNSVPTSRFVLPLNATKEDSSSLITLSSTSLIVITFAGAGSELIVNVAINIYL